MITPSRTPTDEERLELLAYLYPWYRLHRRVDRHGTAWWWAVHRDPMHPRLTAGVFQAIARTSFEGLRDALATQDRLLQAQRPRRW